MLGVGFEPTHTNIAGLKSAPLDQLGQPSVNKLYLLTQSYYFIGMGLYIYT